MCSWVACYRGTAEITQPAMRMHNWVPCGDCMAIGLPLWTNGLSTTWSWSIHAPDDQSSVNASVDFATLVNHKISKNPLHNFACMCDMPSWPWGSILPIGSTLRRLMDGTWMMRQSTFSMNAASLGPTIFLGYFVNKEDLQIQVCASILPFGYLWIQFAKDRSMRAYLELACKAANDGKFLFPVKPKCHASCHTLTFKFELSLSVILVYCLKWVC